MYSASRFNSIRLVEHLNRLQITSNLDVENDLTHRSLVEDTIYLLEQKLNELKELIPTKEEQGGVIDTTELPKSPRKRGPKQSDDSSTVQQEQGSDTSDST